MENGRSVREQDPGPHINTTDSPPPTDNNNNIIIIDRAPPFIPPSPNLLAHSLPSTATLNALPRLGSSTDVSLIPSPASAVPSRPLRGAAPPSKADDASPGTWLFVPDIDISGARLKEVFGLVTEPERRAAVLESRALDLVDEGALSVFVRVWGEDEDEDEGEECRVCGDAYHIPAAIPDVRDTLIEFYSRVYGLRCAIEDCSVRWECKKFSSDPVAAKVVVWEAA